MVIKSGRSTFLSHAAALIGLMLCAAPTAWCKNDNDAYVTVTCTVTLSVDVLDNSQTIDLGSHAPGQVVVSSPMAVRNTGAGAIVQWSLRITTIEVSTTELGYTFAPAPPKRPCWKIGSSSLDDIGLNKMVIAAVFKYEQADRDDFGGPPGDLLGDLLGFDDKVYGQQHGQFGPASKAYHDVFMGNDPGKTMFIPPYPLGRGLMADTRDLYFYVRLPSAVTDQFRRRITIQITTALADDQSKGDDEGDY